MSLSGGLRPSLRAALVVVASGDGDGNGSSSSECDARGHIVGAGRCGAMTACDGDEVRVYMPDNTDADATAE